MGYTRRKPAQCERSQIVESEQAWSDQSCEVFHISLVGIGVCKEACTKFNSAHILGIFAFGYFLEPKYR